MQLAIGMTKNQVLNFVELRTNWRLWLGSVWFYQSEKGNTESFVSKNELLKFCTPIVFDNTDRVTGYGQKFYEQTLSDLGTGQF